jgi:plastocyanin
MNLISLNNNRYILYLFILVIFLTACSKDNSNPVTTGSPNEVVISNFAFSPATLTVKVNSTVKWTNNDSYAHTVSSDTGLFDSGSLSSGASFSRQFTSTGTFTYHCAFHSSMKATIIVN